MAQKRILWTMLMILSLAVFAGCTSQSSNTSTGENEATSNSNHETSEQESEEKVVNLYTSRHYETDDAIYDAFTEETGIEVNVVKGSSDELIERLKREGEQTKADLFFTADAGRLHRAKDQELLQSVKNDTLQNNIPDNLRDRDQQWFGLTKRGRVIAYSKERVDPSELSTYEALTEPKWEGKVLIRSSANIYNQSLLASFITIDGEEKAKDWAQGIVDNMARDPKGNDRDQAKAIVAGVGDVAIMNTYYMGKMVNSSDPEEVKVAEKVGLFFPNQDTTGTHINVSGIGVTKHAPNEDNAVKLIEYLSGEDAQDDFAQANYEYPVNPNVEPSELLQSWGDFKSQDINLSSLGENNANAMKIFQEVGWK